MRKEDGVADSNNVNIEDESVDGSHGNREVTFQQQKDKNYPSKQKGNYKK